MNIQNVSGDARYVSALGVVIDAGATVEVDDDLAAAMIEQPEVWAVPLVVELPQGLLDELQKVLSTLVKHPSHTASPN